MKQIVFLLVLLILSVPNADGAGVKLELLEDFDLSIHKISVSIHLEVEGAISLCPAAIRRR